MEVLIPETLELFSLVLVGWSLKPMKGGQKKAGLSRTGKQDLS